jgi:small subunit ribosomal protein S8
MHQYKLADFLTRIRNALRVSHATVETPHTKLLEKMTAVLQREGFIARYEVSGVLPSEKKIRIFLKYDTDGHSLIRKIQCVSRPGLRKYAGANNLPRVLSGSGILVLSTNEGLLTDRQARKANVGGEVLCMVY